jgi:uncharacterized OB-fold protein
MARQSPIPDELDKPFWDNCNQDRLVLQFCEQCARFQHPPEPECEACGSFDKLAWRAIGGGGTIYSYAVIYDTPITALQEDQPYNAVVVDLDEAPGINIVTQLPGTPADEVPIGAPVEVTFVATPATGQKVPEWRVVR